MDTNGQRMNFSFGMAYIFRDYVISFRECTFGTSECEFKMGAGSLRAHFLDRFGRKFWIASGGRSGRKLLSSAGVVLGSTE